MAEQINARRAAMNPGAAQQSASDTARQEAAQSVQQPVTTRIIDGRR
jgi:hypothetical protein